MVLDERAPEIDIERELRCRQSAERNGFAARSSTTDILAAVSLIRRGSLLMLAFAPFILLTARGRRLSPVLPGTAVRTAAVGIVGGAMWLAILLCFAFHPGLLPTLLLGVLPLLTSGTQAAFAAAHVSHREGRARGRMASAWFGALIGHYVWSVLVLFVIAASSTGNELLIAALLIVPAAILGAAGAALGAVLVTPRR
jgi:hypothetical protein